MNEDEYLQMNEDEHLRLNEDEHLQMNEDEILREKEDEIVREEKILMRDRIFVFIGINEIPIYLLRSFVLLVV